MPAKNTPQASELVPVFPATVKPPNLAREPVPLEPDTQSFSTSTSM